MKRHLLFLFTLITCLQGFSQHGCLEEGYKLENLKNTTTIAIINDEEADHEEIKKVLEKLMPKHWVFSNYKIKTRQEVISKIDTYRKNDAYSFLTIQTSKISGQSDLRFMTLSQDINKKGLLGNNRRSAFSCAHKSCYTVEAEIIKDFIFLNQTLVSIPSNESENWEKLKDYPLEMEQQVILIPEGITDNETTIKIEKYYPFRFKVVSKEELSQAIIKGEKNTYIFDMTYYSYSDYPPGYMSLIDAHGKKVIYHYMMKYADIGGLERVNMNFHEVKKSINKQQKRKKG